MHIIGELHLKKYKLILQPPCASLPRHPPMFLLITEMKDQALSAVRHCSIMKSRSSAIGMKVWLGFPSTKRFPPAGGGFLCGWMFPEWVVSSVGGGVGAAPSSCRRGSYLVWVHIESKLSTQLLEAEFMSLCIFHSTPSPPPPIPSAFQPASLYLPQVCLFSFLFFSLCCSTPGAEEKPGKTVLVLLLWCKSSRSSSSSELNNETEPQNTQSLLTKPRFKQTSPSAW